MTNLMEVQLQESLKQRCFKLGERLINTNARRTINVGMAY